MYQVVPQAGEHDRNLPASGSHVGFADVEEVSQPAFRGAEAMATFTFAKRAIGQRIHAAPALIP